MKNDKFKRIETKYILTEEQKNKLLNEIAEYIEEDEYFKSTICNVYYDDACFDLIINSLEKPVYKSKVRIRSYGIPKLDDNIYIEIKSKYKGIVEKRRISMLLKDFYDYQEKKKYDSNNQILKEINYFFDYYHLKPVIYIAYDRICYCAHDNKNIRITFDNNLRSRFDDLRLELGDYGQNYFDSDKYIMEIKILGSMPLWLASSLSKLKIYPSSFSKYGKIYEKVKGEIVYD